MAATTPAKRLKIDPLVVPSASLHDSDSSDPLTPCMSDREDDDSDDDLPNVSLSFGTPTHGAVSFDGIVVGEVYWITYPNWPPWPAIVTQPPRIENRKKRKTVLKCAFFFDPTLDPNQKTIQETRVKLGKDCIHSFNEDPIRLRSFMDDKVRVHKKYVTSKKALDSAITDVKLYLLRKNDMAKGDSPTSLFQSVCRRRLVLSPSDSKLAFHCDKEDDEDEEEEEDEKKKETPVSVIALEEREKLRLKKEELRKDERYSFEKILTFLGRHETKAYLSNILSGSEESTRHKRFLDCSPKVQHRLSLHTHFGPWMYLDEAQKGEILDCLREVSKEYSKCISTTTEDYLFGVLLPEAVIRMTMAVESLSQEQASQKYKNIFS